MLVAQNVAKAELAGFALGLGASVEWAVLGSELLGRVTRHPEGFLVDHCHFAPEEIFACCKIGKRDSR